MRLLNVVVAAGVLLVSSGSGEGQTYSDLWGRHGERWSPQGRLPDFSRAGYRCGEAPIPDVPVVANVRDFGATGDGVTDDTRAILDAVAAVERGAVHLPAGRYVLTDRIRIARSGVVLRGDGPGKTVLVIPKSLLQIQDENPIPEGRTRQPHFSFGGAFVEVSGGRRQGERIGDVTRPAKRGDFDVVCGEASSVKPGTFIRLVMEDGASLGRHLHAGQEAGEEQLERGIRVDQVARVVGVEGDRVTMDRPLRFDVELEWQPALTTFDPSIEEVGIEGLTFAFSGKPKPDHLVEEGFNAIQLRGLVNGWVRNVTFEDADMGVKLSGTRFCTVEDVTFTAPKRTTRWTGHHAIWAARAQENLIQRFRLETAYVHDLSVEGWANGNVFRDGSGVAVNFDHHRIGPYENLFTDIDAGNGRRLWYSGGSRNRGPHSAARTTLWNVRHRTDEMRPVPGWPLVNVIGVSGYVEAKDPDGTWIEAPGGVLPLDLYEAQRTATAAR